MSLGSIFDRRGTDDRLQSWSTDGRRQCLSKDRDEHLAASRRDHRILDINGKQSTPDAHSFTHTKFTIVHHGAEVGNDWPEVGWMPRSEEDEHLHLRLETALTYSLTVSRSRQQQACHPQQQNLLKMSDLDPATPSPTPAKRPRPVISCFECRRKKLKCSRTYPCQQCIKIGRPGRCEYQAGQEPEPNTEYTVSSDRPNKRQRVSALFENIGREESSEQPQLRGQEQVSASHGTHGIIEDLQARMARLENAVFPQTSHPASSSISRHGSPEQLPARDGARKSHVRGTLSEISSQVSPSTVNRNLPLAGADAHSLMMLAHLCRGWTKILWTKICSPCAQI